MYLQYLLGKYYKKIAQQMCLPIVLIQLGNEDSFFHIAHIQTVQIVLLFLHDDSTQTCSIKFFPNFFYKAFFLLNHPHVIWFLTQLAAKALKLKIDHVRENKEFYLFF